MQEKELSRIFDLRKEAEVMEEMIELQHSAKEYWPYLSNRELLGPRVKPLAKFDFERLKGVPMLRNEMNVGEPWVLYELPWVWYSPYYMHGESLWSLGPLQYMKFATQLIDTGKNRCRLKIQFSYVPHGEESPEAVKQIFEAHVHAYQELDRQIPQGSQEELAVYFDKDEATLEKAEDLKEKWQHLMPHSEIPGKLAEFICTAPNPYLFKMRPFKIANRYGLSEIDVLRFCMLATKEGFLDLSWEILCPSCQGPNFQASSLEEMKADEHCGACNIAYDANFDKNVEVVFRPTPDLRIVTPPLYCLGSAGNMPHVKAQFVIGPKRFKKNTIFLTPGTYKISRLGLPGEMELQVSLDAPKKEIDLSLSEENWGVPLPPVHPLMKFILRNEEEQWKTVRFTDLSYRDGAVTAYQVTLLQDYKDLFDSEVLKPGIKLGVSNLAVLFSDLKDSTQLYEEQGDAAAFSLVEDHFGIMREIIRGTQGGIVKTIGDAVMAAFTSSEDAVRAGLEMIKTFEEWNREHDEEQQIGIKLGVHKGPCIALNLNDKLDYFGSTVNRAARIQGSSEAGELVLSQEVHEDLRVKHMLEEDDTLKISPFKMGLKGFTGDYTLYRVYHDMTPPV